MLPSWRLYFVLLSGLGPYPPQFPSIYPFFYMYLPLITSVVVSSPVVSEAFDTCVTCRGPVEAYSSQIYCYAISFEQNVLPVQYHCLFYSFYASPCCWYCKLMRTLCRRVRSGSLNSSPRGSIIFPLFPMAGPIASYFRTLFQHNWKTVHEPRSVYDAGGDLIRVALKA